MDGNPSGAETAPEIELRQLSVEAPATVGRWRIGWQIVNRGKGPLTVLAVLVPHGQFKATERRFEPAAVLPAGDAWRFYTDVFCAEPPGLVTENGFVILEVTWAGEPWRVFARVSVVVGAAGKPQAKTEAITTQKVGFSRIHS
jgi:hypothetical protein